MSGIVGILNLDGAPIDRTLLERLTNSLQFRGPDAQRTWFRGQIGFGHTLLRCAKESKDEHQPFQLDGTAWIIADARVDGREDLIAALAAHGHGCSLEAHDAELILRAYQVWGEKCVERLIGDFIFAIWDARSRKLMIGRDHFGMRTLFYARVGNSLIFSNTLKCVRKHPGVSSRLNDVAIADFLVYDNNQDLDTTAFADIRRLPPASTLVAVDGAVSIRRYWSLPEMKEARYQRPEDCLDKFAEVLDAAVSDRLRENSASMLLSGGLDSPAIAIAVRRVLDRRNSNFDFRAFTTVHSKLIPHEERYYGGLVSKALNIPTRLLEADTCRVFDQYDDPQYAAPEPVHLPMGFGECDPFRETAPWSRTALTGLGGDPVLASLLTGHYKRLYKNKQYGRMVSDAASFLMADGRFHRLYLWKRLTRRFRPSTYNPSLPTWLNPDLVRRLDLKDRWATMKAPFPPNNSARPEGHQCIASPYWTHTFEVYDTGNLGQNLKVCHPFFDLRVLNFLLALPVLPWCSDKEILRRAARGVLPDAVRLRKKSPLMQDPVWAMLQKPESAWVDSYQAVPELADYVLRDQVPTLYRIPDAGDAWVHSKPLSLNFWLERRHSLDSYLKDPIAQVPALEDTRAADQEMHLKALGTNI